MNLKTKMPQSNRYVICYPGGSGGSFLSAALNSIKHNRLFNVNIQLGHCHDNNINAIPNFYHGDSIESFYKELEVIQSFDFTKHNIFHGHCRNIVAIKETISKQISYNELEKTKFIKISVDHQKPNEIMFVAAMLRKKVNCFPDLSFEEFLNQTTNYIKSWYWIENAYTASHTINLSLSDLFLNQIGNLLELSKEESNRVNQYQNKYLAVQKQLHSEVLEFIT